MDVVSVCKSEANVDNSKICTLSNGQQGALDKESDSIEVYKKRPLPVTWFMTLLRTFCTNLWSVFMKVFCFFRTKKVNSWDFLNIIFITFFCIKPASFRTKTVSWKKLKSSNKYRVAIIGGFRNTKDSFPVHGNISFSVKLKISPYWKCDSCHRESMLAIKQNRTSLEHTSL